MSGARAASAVLGVVLVAWLPPVGAASAAVIYSYEAHLPPASVGSPHVAPARRPAPALSGAQSSTRRRSDAEPSSSTKVRVRAPDGAPLNSISSTGEGENTAGVSSGKGDPLVENGLSSPLCKGSMSGGLSSAAQSNCQTSGFVGAPAPTGDYAIDVNIDVGPFGLSKGGLLSVIQDVFVTPLWNALVWVVHALVVTVVKLDL